MILRPLDNQLPYTFGRRKWPRRLAIRTSETARTIFFAVAVLMAIYGLALLVFPQAMFTAK